MGDEMQFQNWMWEQSPGGPIVVCEQSRSRRPVAVLEGCGDEKGLVRASLIAAAPGLYATLAAFLPVLRLMADEEAGKPAGLAAQDMIPAVEHALQGADFMGEVTPDKLVGA